ncbi:MAG: hypothetical protein E6J90_12300 [Deltaproteobacteria bacterium]|nr:MAG: hypothetical protein E6J90_12300 [Deltaproteobacteria bacterium]
MRGAVAIAGLAAACAGRDAPDPGVESLELTHLAPATIVPGTRLVVTGASFVDAPWGETTLHLQGRSGARAIDVAWPAAFVDFTTLGVAIDRGRLAELGGDGAFRGTATVEVVAASDHRRYRTRALPVELELRTRLAPATAALAGRGVIFVNDAIELSGDGFLLGGDEGASVVQVAGCVALQAGGACRPVAMIELPLTAIAGSRSRARFAFSPRIAGIQSGAFTGTIAVVNRQPGEAPLSAAPVDVAYDLVSPQVFSIDPPAASLGQYVLVRGGGWIGNPGDPGGEPGAVTEFELSGTLRRSGGAALPFATTLIPEVVDGRLARYVINTDDALGHALDLRGDTGELTASVTPVVSFGGDRVRGPATPIRLAIAPVKQVVYLAFAPSYVEGLRDFGLRAASAQIRDRILAACREAYRGVGIEFRTEPPSDFALFSTVELVGVDPNDQGLFGYDNSPGKDSGNLRLYDRLGGVNAQTQEDGSPGFGGVFVRSLLGFSPHPGRLARSVAGADPVFDQLFDPFRADRGGTPVSAADLAGEQPALGDGGGCPARDRARQIQCAIFALGNLIGGTVAHEGGHSLGLANPYQDGFHDPGDAPNRLMDAGDARPFLERAQLMGQGPAVFCDGEYAYLRRILPSAEPASAIARPGCS